ncbi:MAG: ferrous iron transport protein B [Candidatus Accumulibacter sp.]|jgi:ferrous iron transport protein B|nr:ferrous iron transport protein B [Accumulibacter sp.]
MTIRIALAGNPNSGKTTLFNALTGSNQFVGNWPGVTIAKKEGKLKGAKDVLIVDLPGIYSLSPYSLEEVIARDYLADERPDAILNIIDGTNLERNLFLTTQLVEMGIPVVTAVNMMDAVNKLGNRIDFERLSETLACKALGISALSGEGIVEAAEAAIAAADQPAPTPRHGFSGSVEHTLAHIEEAVLHDLPDNVQRWYAIKLFERDEKIAAKLNVDAATRAHLEEDIRKCETEMDDDSESIITSERYAYIESVIGGCLTTKKKGALTVSDRIDLVVTNRFFALPIFAFVMFVVYFVSVTTVGSYATDWANDGVFGKGWELFGARIPGVPAILGEILTSIDCAQWLQSLILDGIVAGVGAVIGFIPQMLILFFFLAFLESCGYMARIAFIMDRIFRKFGMSGKSFIPILIGSGCGVPGILSSRTIENERDRRMTIMTTTFIPCSAKLPVIALISGALFSGAWWVAPSAYFVGIVAIVCSGVILKKTRLFSGDPAPFVMELPPYRWPAARNVFFSMWERSWSFMKKAGSIILLSTIFVWFASSFGWSNEGFGSVEMPNSLLARVGSAVSWIFAPLGWGEWQPTVAALTGLIAKENVVGTFGILYGFTEVAEDGEEVWAVLQSSFTVVSAYSFLVFNLLCAPCVAAMGAIRREMNSAKWFSVAIAYQCVLAYLVAFCIYQFGKFFTGAGFDIGVAAALAVTAFFLYALFRAPTKSLAERAD